MTVSVLFDTVEEIKEEREKDKKKCNEAIHMIVQELTNMCDEFDVLRESVRGSAVDDILQKSSFRMKVRSKIIWIYKK